MLGSAIIIPIKIITCTHAQCMKITCNSLSTTLNQICFIKMHYLIFVNQGKYTLGLNSMIFMGNKQLFYWNSKPHGSKLLRRHFQNELKKCIDFLLSI